MLAHRLQGIGIEERAALERDAGDDTIVKGALQHIIILRFAVKQEESVVDIDVADGGAGLAIGRHVGQLEVASEGLAAGGAADAAGDVHLARDDVVPDAVYGTDVGCVARERRHIGHAAVHIGGTHGVTDGLLLLHDGQMGLRILVAPRGVAAFVEEVFGHVEILLLAGDHGELGQRHLGNLVSGHTLHLSLAAAYLADDAVGIGPCDVEEGLLSRSLIVGDGTLHHVAQVVELMREVLHLLPSVGAGPGVGMGGIHRARGVEIAVGLLCSFDDAEHGVHIVTGPHGALPALAALRVGHGNLQLQVGEGLQQIGAALDGLIDVGVVEGVAPHLHLVRVLAGELFGGYFEVAVASGLFAFGEGQRHGDVARRRESLPPKRGGSDLHLCEGHGGNRVVLSL